jgi:CHAT domain-containing protein
LRSLYNLHCRPSKSGAVQLRSLTEKQVKQLRDQLTGGQLAQLQTEVARGAPVRVFNAGAVSATPHPYAHPHYWAAFVLIGDPR